MNEFEMCVLCAKEEKSDGEMIYATRCIYYSYENKYEIFTYSLSLIRFHH